MMAECTQYDVEEGKDISPRLLEKEAGEEASAESVLSLVVEAELGGDHDKRLVFESDSESSSDEEEEEDNIR